LNGKGGLLLGIIRGGKNPASIAQQELLVSEKQTVEMLREVCLPPNRGSQVLHESDGLFRPEKTSSWAAELNSSSNWNFLLDLRNSIL
jgi:hypothetical protein